MGIIDIKLKLGQSAKSIFQKKIFDALNILGSVARELGNSEFISEVERLYDNYSAMLRFFISGANDAEFEERCNTIAVESLSLAMKISREISMDTSSEIYFSTARTLLNDGKQLSHAVDEYINEIRRLDKDYESMVDPKRTIKAEQMLRDIFNRIWVTHPLSDDDFTAIDRMVSQSMPKHARASVISAVGLGLYCYYDTRRFKWLLEQYMKNADSEPDLALRAMVDFMTAALRYRRRPFAVSLVKTLETAREMATWDKDFTAVAIELMRTMSTKEISQKIKKGIFDEIGNLDDEIKDKLKKGEIDMESLTSDANPEWEEKLSNSSLGKSLREMAEIQAEGGDVFMTSFSQMKRFPFFHEIPNWFLPFYEGHSAVVSADTEGWIISSLLSKMPILCDSDKYSLILSIAEIPDGQKKQLGAALQMQAEQMADSLSEVEKASSDTVRKNIINKYVQSIYRFLNLFRNRKDFINIFESEGQSPDVLQVDALRGNPADINLYETIAQFYFISQNWKEAAVALEKIDKKEMPDALRSQQLGYAFEKSGDKAKALSRYEESEMLDDNSEWTKKRIAHIASETGDYNRAADIYRRLSEKHPDNGRLAYLTAYNYFKGEMYAEAETAAYKAHYLLPEDSKIVEILAASLLFNNKIDKAKSSFENLEESMPSSDANLYLAYIANAGKDIALTLTRLNNAIDYLMTDLKENEALTALEDKISEMNERLSRINPKLRLGEMFIDAIKYSRNS